MKWLQVYGLPKLPLFLARWAMRLGLPQLETPPKPRKGYTTPSTWVGEILVPSLDDVHEALAYAEGEEYR